ncbi:uncharacterized protein LOC136043275, partial [Artemia franciscana]|uniref:uncharacterized protein LOC136043275 n=1 Tax=Artemia franciscana TaxID=6661 RepID=UPI0032DB09F7
MSLKPAYSRFNEEINQGSSISYMFVSWNLNENLLNHSLLLKDFLSKCDIMCIQEQFATTLSLSLLELSTNHKASQFTDVQMEDLRASFALFDQDGDGHITTSELTAVMKCLGQNPTDAEILAIIKEVDAD